MMLHSSPTFLNIYIDYSYIIPIRFSLTSDTGSFFKCQTDSTKRRFSVAYSFSRKERKWSLPAGSLSNSQPVIKLMILIIQTASWELFAPTLNHLQLVARKRSTQREFGHLEELLQNGKMAKVGASSKRGQLLDKVWVKFSVIFNQSNQVEVSTCIIVLISHDNKENFYQDKHFSRIALQ